MPSPYGRGVAVAVFLFVLTLSSVSYAAETNALTINDPFTDAIQLWSAVRGGSAFLHRALSRISA